jgi:hypothetical protein
MPFLIDGYNLLRAVQKQLEQAEFAEAELCLLLREFLRRVRQRGTIVFDGIGPPHKERLQGAGSLQIIFSGRDVEADTVIERLIAENTAPKRLAVVSSDRRILSAAKRRKCPGVKVLDFWRQVCLTVEKETPIREPQEKQRGISSAETELWLQEFGLGKKRSSLQKS